MRTFANLFIVGALVSLMPLITFLGEIMITHFPILVNFASGKRQDQWIRYHEKGGIVASMNFENDILDGCLSADFNRGYGNGSGMSYIIKAVFQNGVLVESFHLSHTDPYGHTVVLNGKLVKTGELKIDHQKNIKLAGDGTLNVNYGRFRSSFHCIQEFIINEINRRVMTKFSLWFCNRSENIWPCKFPQGTISILCEPILGLKIRNLSAERDQGQGGMCP